MRTDIISSETELAMAANQLCIYAEFLAESLQTYVQILRDLQGENGAIKDQLICARLNQIINEVQDSITALCDEGETIRVKTAEYTAGVAKVDKFSFPTGIADSVRTLLRQLL